MGLALLTLMTVLMVSAATSVHLQQIRLTHLSDEMLLDAAIATHLAQSQSRVNLPDVRVIAVDTFDGNTASVTVAVTVQPLFGMEALLPFADGIVLVATGTGRAY
jgi:hypothetical protein